MQTGEQDTALGRHRLFETADVSVAAELGARIMAPHRLWADPGHDFLGSFSAVPLAQSTILLQRMRGAARLRSSAPMDFYMLLLATRDGIDVVADGEAVRVGPGEALVLSPTEHLQMSFGNDVELRGAKIPVDVVTRQLGLLTGQAAAAPRLEHRTAGSAAWVSVLRLAVDTIDQQASGLFPARLGRQLEQALVTTLLLGHPGSQSGAVHREAGPVDPRTMRAAAKLIRADPAAVRSVAAVAAEVGIGLRRLQAGFQATYGTTPSAFLRDARLDEAHRLLAGVDASRTTVSEAASAAGFANFGRFSADYRARFGINPSGTLRCSISGSGQPARLPGVQAQRQAAAIARRPTGAPGEKRAAASADR